MLTILVGIIASVAAEAVTLVNKWLSGTVLKGDGAFVIAMLLSLVAAIIKIYFVPLASFQSFLASFTEIWAVSQVFFIGVVQLLGLDVKPSA